MISIKDAEDDRFLGLKAELARYQAEIENLRERLLAKAPSFLSSADLLTTQGTTTTTRGGDEDYLSEMNSEVTGPPPVGDNLVPGQIFGPPLHVKSNDFFGKFQMPEPDDSHFLLQNTVSSVSSNHLQLMEIERTALKVIVALLIGYHYF